MSKRKIVLFADGTGNAFTTQESNVWRIYRALDLSQSDQIGFYVKGVGTSGFALWAKLDGATGIGVPANVRLLYRFLCWNWREGDEIYAFGFSRGAFTIRTLIGLIKHEGLLPTEVNGQPVTQRQMLANSNAAWRRYRAATASDKVLWTVHASRAIRDLALWVAGFFRKSQFRYNKIRAAVTEQKRRDVPIEFVGLFDTVEAYGLPVEELRGVVDWAIWPISFRERSLYEKVKHARHALALDDERTSFHPIRFDQTNEPDKDRRIKEVWFAGMHSDVGGGYPDNLMELIPLTWIAAEAELVTIDANGNRAVNGLRFVPGAIQAYREAASPYGICHNSRAGTGIFYRYSPRVISTNIIDGGATVIHHSVAEKMAFGNEHYAPVVLPEMTCVLMPDGSITTIKGFNASDYVSVMAPDRPSSLPSDDDYANAMAYNAVAKLRHPNPDYLELTRDTIWWRRVAYFSMMAGFAAVISLPFTAARIRDIWHDSAQTVAGWFGPEAKAQWDKIWDESHSAEQGASAILHSVAQVAGNLVPGYLKPWIDVIVEAPVASSLIIAVFVMALAWHGRLRDKINDRAHLAWFASARDRRKAAIYSIFSPTPDNRMRQLARQLKNSQLARQLKNSKAAVAVSSTYRFVRYTMWLRLARRLRTSETMTGAYRIWSQKVVPGVFLAAILIGVVVMLSRNTVTYRGEQASTATHFGFCDPTKTPKTLEYGEVVVRDGEARFKADSLCWSSGVQLEKGRKYTLWINATEPFFDRTMIADVAGFNGSWAQTIALPIRRWWTADWFQPIARVTSTTDNKEWPLVAVNGLTPRAYWKGTDGKTIAAPNVDTKVEGMCNPIPKESLPVAQQAHRALEKNINRDFISEFIAPADGELFLYVNDAIFAVPFFDTVRCWYDNNSGSAKISIRKEPLPAPEPAAGGAASVSSR